MHVRQYLNKLLHMFAYKLLLKHRLYFRLCVRLHVLIDPRQLLDDPFVDLDHKGNHKKPSADA